MTDASDGTDEMKFLTATLGAGSNKVSVSASGNMEIFGVTKLASEIVEAECYLKSQKGFGDAAMDRRTRVMYAALLASSVFGGSQEAAGNSVISNTLSIIWAKKIAKMISMLIQVAPSVASAMIKNDGKEEKKE